MIAYHLPLNDAAFNLAFEDLLFRSLTPGHPGYFLLWRNRPSVIVGRHQNTAAEVSEAFLNANGITAVRRITGGGAVYHDGGNLNYSFLIPNKTGAARPGPVDGNALLKPLLAALAGLGIEAECSGRNDVTANGKKISGTAQFKGAQGTLFHGAMLIDVDMHMLAASLTGDPDKYMSKALPSVRARVCNVAELLPEKDRADAVAVVAEAVLAAYQLTPTDPDPSLLDAASALADARYRAWEWNYGVSPAFTETKKHRFPWGAVECCFSVRNGLVESCRFYGDFFSEREMAELEGALAGVSRNPEALTAVLRSMPLGEFFLGSDGVDVLGFISSV